MTPAACQCLWIALLSVTFAVGILYWFPCQTEQLLMYFHCWKTALVCTVHFPDVYSTLPWYADMVITYFGTVPYEVNIHPVSPSVIKLLRNSAWTRDVPQFGLGRTSAEYSAEGFCSVRFGHASTFGRTSVLFSLGFALRSAHFIACVQSLYSKN